MKADHCEKILAVERIMKQNPYGITVNQIIYLLEKKYDIKAERKSIYNNIAVLTRFMKIDKFKANGQVYFCTRKEIKNEL